MNVWDRFRPRWQSPLVSAFGTLHYAVASGCGDVLPAVVDAVVHHRNAVIPAQEAVAKLRAQK